MLVGFIGYVAYTLYIARGTAQKNPASQPQQEVKDNAIKISFKILVGLAELIVGSNIFVGHATSLATTLGVSDAVIGITILGAGTSLPELATSAVAALKGRTSMALGNVIGSCLFNILMPEAAAELPVCDAPDQGGRVVGRGSPGVTVRAAPGDLASGQCDPGAQSPRQDQVRLTPCSSLARWTGSDGSTGSVESAESEAFRSMAISRSKSSVDLKDL